MGKMEQEEHEVGEPVYGASVELVQRVRKQVQTEERKNYFYRGLLSGLLVALLILSSVYVITTIQRRNRQNQGESVTQQELSAFNEKTYDKMREIEKLIYAEYYENDIDADAMENGVYRGIVASLGDQYAQYYTPNEYHSQMISSEGIYFGIGASVGFDAVTGSPELVTINKNSAAEEIGLRDGDVLNVADGESLEGLTLSEIVSKIKGPENTTVTILIYRGSEDRYLTFEVKRQKYEEVSVESRMLGSDIAYIAITRFETVTVGQFATALQAAKDAQMKGLILDLRGNPGGTLSSVLQIARMLLPKGLILYVEDKYGNRTEYTCDGTNQIQVPVVVLVNAGSASASEVLAGALKDHQIATLVGETTYGKGIVQSLYELDDGSAVKMTICAYYTPNGTTLHRIGIEPDVVCEFDDELYKELEIDTQLEKAKEVIAKMIP